MKLNLPLSIINTVTSPDNIPILTGSFLPGNCKRSRDLSPVAWILQCQGAPHAYFCSLLGPGRFVSA